LLLWGSTLQPRLVCHAGRKQKQLFLYLLISSVSLGSNNAEAVYTIFRMYHRVHYFYAHQQNV
jgi:hypothetical protein